MKHLTDVIAHTIRDGSRYAGSGAIESGADSLWHYDGPTGGKPGKISFHKLRLGDKNRMRNYAFTTEIVARDTEGAPVNTVVAVDEVPAEEKPVDGAGFGDVRKQEGGGNGRPTEAEARRNLMIECMRELTAADPAKGCAAVTLNDKFNAKRRRPSGGKTLGKTVLRDLRTDMVEDGELLMLPNKQFIVPSEGA